MAKDKNVIPVGIDFGASSIKVSYNNGTTIEDFKLANRIETNIDVSSGKLVQVNDEAVRVGSLGGFSNSTAKKINYRYLEEILYAIGHTLKEKLEIEEDEINLFVKTCLPPKQFQESKEEYKKLIGSLGSKKGTVDGEDVKLNIHNVTCGAEGAVLLKSYNLEKMASGLKKIMLMDIGSSTTDIIVLEKNEISEAWDIVFATTSEFAGEKMCRDIEKALNSGTGLNYKWEVLERSGEYQLDGKMHPITGMADSATNTVKSLMSDIEKIGSLREYKVILAGNGSRLLSNNDFFKNVCPDFAMVDAISQTYGNSRGCLKN